MSDAMGVTYCEPVTYIACGVHFLLAIYSYRLTQRAHAASLTKEARTITSICVCLNLTMSATDLYDEMTV